MYALEGVRVTERAREREREERKMGRTRDGTVRRFP